MESPWAIVSDNETQFNSGPFREFYSGFGIQNYYSMPAYPQSNGRAEVSNRIVLVGINKRLEEAKGKWTEELFNVLWAYRTTPRASIGETPYAMTYRVEAVIPLEV